MSGAAGKRGAASAAVAAAAAAEGSDRGSSVDSSASTVAIEGTVKNVKQWDGKYVADDPPYAVGVGMHHRVGTIQ
jgi:hypothetical protein